ncbi:MAG: FtsQ-type POTRA domain-containing protein [Actinomycetota bacterium]|nr:FtsQ-type POTRA domain-containing protein [Actinomycetota bacterium]
MSTATRVRPDPRISRRRMAVARARRRRLAARAGGALAGATLVWGILWSPLLDVRHVTVAGGEHTSSRAVADAAGLDVDDNLLFVSASDVAARTEELPWVKSAKVDRILPSTVRVRVVERVAAMTVTTESGSWMIDASGRVLAPAAEDHGLPTIAATGLGEVEPGATVNQLAVRAAVRAFGSMPKELQSMIKGGAATSSERITFSLEGDTLLRYGAAEQMGDKNEVALALVERFAPGSEPLDYIDVRVPSNPAVSSGPPQAASEEEALAP